MSFLAELWQFMRVRKKYWLLPLLTSLVAGDAFAAGLLTGAAVTAVAMSTWPRPSAPARRWTGSSTGACCR